MDSPAMVAMPLPMCKTRSGSFALQGTSLEEQRFSGQRGNFFSGFENASAKAQI